MINKTEKEIMQNWQGDIKMPIVSICTITYNHEKYISETINGFLMQETSFPFEIVIDDDCSLDNTAELIKQYVYKFPNIIKAHIRKKNIGAMQNYMENMKRSKGKYIALCEGDDYWIDVLKLQKQVEFLDENLNFGIVCTDMIRYHQKSKKYSDSKIIPLGRSAPFNKKIIQGYFYEELMEWKSQIWTLTVCFRKCLLKNLPKLDSSKYFTGDRLVFLHISLQSKIKYFEEKTAVYRILEDSASHIKNPIKALEFLYKLANLMLYFLKNHPVNNKLHEVVLYKYMFIKFQYSLASGDYNIYRSVKLILPLDPSIRMITFKVLYMLCKSKVFFRILSFVYKKRVLGVYKNTSKS